MIDHTTASIDPPAWSVDMFAAFWSNPDPALVPAVLTEDVVGHWAGRDEPVHGREDYVGCIAAIVEALPDMRLEVAEHAQSGEYVFIRWVLHATGEHGPFELTGMDRVRVRGPQVAENVIVFDTAAFEARSGKAIPWVR
jgi:SnoaL-like polyketide cyclase